jgi:O-antigen/teichoic acid export membrane protein
MRESGSSLVPGTDVSGSVENVGRVTFPGIEESMPDSASNVSALDEAQVATRDSDHSYLRWSYLSTGSSAIMQLIAVATITRFLRPSDYGLAALATLCSSLTGYFTQLGVGRAIVQKAGLTTGNIRAAFTLGLTTGVFGFSVLTLISPLLARYFREPRLPPVIVMFGLNLIFQALGSVGAGLLRREFRIRELALCDFFAYLLSTFGIGLPMAMRGLGIWALVGSNVSLPLIAAIAYFLARPHPVKPTFNRADYAQITSFSAKASITTTIEALSGSLDMIIMGRIVSPAAIGLYNRSLTLSMQPGYNVSMGVSRVFHPTIARAAERSRKECLEILVKTERQLMSLIFPLCGGAAVAAQTIIPAVFGRQWTSAIPAYRWLCLAAALDASLHLPAVQLEIFNLFRHKFILQVWFGICFGIGILVFASRGGIAAVAIALAAMQAVRTAGMHVFSARSLGVSPSALLRSWIPGLLCSGLVGGLLAATQGFMSQATILTPPVKLGVLVLIGTVALGSFYRFLYKESIYDHWAALFRSTNKPLC